MRQMRQKETGRLTLTLAFMQRKAKEKVRVEPFQSVRDHNQRLMKVRIQTES